MNKKLAVIITIHNRLHETIDCLSSIYSQELLLDVYLTDDGSDKEVSKILKTKFPNIQIIRGDGTLYWNRGMYKAWEAAMVGGYDYYLWLNNDTILKDNSIDNLIKICNEENDDSLICGATVSKKNKEIITYGGYNKNIILNSISSSSQNCEFASGNVILVPRKISDTIGNLDYYYHHSLGDFDYEGRARKQGFKIIQAPGYYGYCDRHKMIAKWRDSQIPLYQRILFLYSPLGRNPFEFFHYDHRHYNIFIAIFHFFSIHLRCFFPKLWGKRYWEKE